MKEGDNPKQVKALEQRAPHASSFWMRTRILRSQDFCRNELHRTSRVCECFKDLEEAAQSSTAYSEPEPGSLDDSEVFRIGVRTLPHSDKNEN